MDDAANNVPGRVLFFDGVCVMCNGLVERLLRADKDHLFRFASLQGETADAARKKHPEIPSELETMVYMEDDQVYMRSAGVFAAMKHMPYPWKALSWFRWLPKWLTDIGYSLVAKTRYRVFGKYEQCPVPPVEDRARFLP